MMKWIKDIFSPKQRPCRRPTVKLGVEWLEERDCPSTFWLDSLRNDFASYSQNWSNGLPSATNQAVFDPKQGTPDSITWDSSILCNGIVVQNGWSGSFTFSQGNTVSTNANFSINGLSTVTFQGASTSPMKLIDGAAVTVASGSLLQLDNGGNTAGVTFFQGDQNSSEILSNSGTVTYLGYASTVPGGVQDYIKVPVLNNGTFNVNGGNGGGGGASPLIGGQAVGSTLNVSGSSGDTGNVSWYQNNSAAVTNLYGNVTLLLQSGYTQTAGILETSDSQSETLTVQNTSVYGTVNINGGKVQVNPGDTTHFGVFTINAQTVNLSGEIDEAVAYDLSASDLIHMDNVSGETLNCKPGSSLVVTSNGNILAGKSARNVLQAQRITDGTSKNPNLQITKPAGLFVNVGSMDISVSS